MPLITRTRSTVLAVAAALAGGGVYVWHRTRVPAVRDTVDRTAAVKRQDLTLQIVESGSLKAVRSVKLTVQTARPVKLVKVLPEGTVAQPGSVVAEMDREDAERQLEQAALDLDNAQKSLEIAKEMLHLQQVTNDNNLQVARDALEQAQKSLDEYVELEGPKLSKDFSIRLADAKVKLEDARKQRADLVDQQEAELFVEESQEDQNLKALESTNRAIQTAQTSLEVVLLDQKIFKLYGYPTELLRRKQALAKAKIDLEQTRIGTHAAILDKEAQLANRVNDLEQKTQALKRAREEIAKLTLLVGSVGGIVTYGDADNPWARLDVKVGQEYSRGQILATIPNTSAYEVVLQVGEEYRSRLKKGLEAIATFDAVPGVALKGTVSDISNLATSRGGSWDPEASKVYVVTVALDGGNPQLTPGMSTKVEIIVGRLKGVLTVPVEAVHREEGKAFCYLEGAPGEPPRQREVKVGPGTDDEVSIESGLSEGDQVVLGKIAGGAP